MHSTVAIANSTREIIDLTFNEIIRVYGEAALVGALVGAAVGAFDGALVRALVGTLVVPLPAFPFILGPLPVLPTLPDFEVVVKVVFAVGAKVTLSPVDLAAFHCSWYQSRTCCCWGLSRSLSLRL